MKKLLAAALMLCLLLGMGTVAMAEKMVCTDDSGNEYSSLQAAFTGSQSGSVITLTDDIVMTTDMTATVPAGKTLTLNMAGHEITVETNFIGRPIVNEGTLTVTGNGVIDSSMSEKNGYGAINNKGNLTVENGTYRGATYGEGSCIRNTGKDAVLRILDGTFEKATCAIYNEGTAVLENGTYSGTTCSQCNSNIWAYTIRNYLQGGAPKMTINGGSYTGVQGAVSSSSGYLEINAGDFKTIGCVNNPDHTATFYALYVAGEAEEAVCVVNNGHFETEGKVAAALIGNDADGGDKHPAISYIKGGVFVAPENVPALKGAKQTGDPEVLGGIFTTDVSEHVKDESLAIAAVGADGNETYAVGNTSIEEAIVKAPVKEVTITKGNATLTNVPEGVKITNEGGTVTVNGKPVPAGEMVEVPAAHVPPAEKPVYRDTVTIEIGGEKTESTETTETGAEANPNTGVPAFIGIAAAVSVLALGGMVLSKKK